jgi:7,8-dihydropterin-6-yl-methyl-4-(beta-D-ribofuranosyl)aminobenzene 5'-phosphate synthase
MQEQALAINVKDKGIVFIVGCGHQTIPKLIKRLHSCFDEPLYGLIGGLHLSCSSSRNMGFIKYVGSGRPPWSPIDKDIIKGYIKELQLTGVKVIGLSAHDSCDSTLAIFKNAFDKRYVEIRAGQPIDINIKKE